MSIFTVLHSNGLGMDFITKFPLATFGFEWIIPAIIGG